MSLSHLDFTETHYREVSINFLGYNTNIHHNRITEDWSVIVYLGSGHTLESNYLTEKQVEELLNCRTKEEVNKTGIFHFATEPVVLETWHKSGKMAYTAGSSPNYEQDKLVIKADSEESALKYFKDNAGFGKSGEYPPYVVSKKWDANDLTLTCLATYCGYD